MRPSLSPCIARFGHMLIRWAKWLIVLAAFIQLCIYAIDVHTRKTEVPGCKWNPVKNHLEPPDAPPPYLGRFCYLSNDMILLQLYDVGGEQLLAERMYRYPDIARLTWVTNEKRRLTSLQYDSLTGDNIAVPPTLLDRLRAMLP